MKKIIEKYPKIFVEYEGNPGMVNYSGVPQAWIPTIDLLCEQIQDYCNGRDSMLNPDYVENKKYDYEDSTTHRYLDIPREQIVCSQIKEKFGELRFYTFSTNSFIEGLIAMTEAILWNTCESCGSRDNITTTKGWIRRVCSNCVNN